MKFNFSEIAKLKGITNVYTDNFPKPLLKKSLQDLKLSEDTEVLYLWTKYDSNEALIVTTDLISCINEKKYLKLFHFNNISRVYFSPDSIFYLYDFEGERCGTIPARFFGLESKNVITATNRDSIKDFFNYRLFEGNFKYNVDGFYKIAIKEIEDLGDVEEIEKLELIQQEEYADKIISIYDNFVNTYGKSEVYFSLEFFLAVALSLKKENLEALKIVDNIIDNFSRDANLEFWYSCKAGILADTNKIYDAAIYLKKAYDLTIDTQQKLNYKKQILEFTEKFNINFTELPIQERKLILISDDFKKTPANSFIVLNKKSLPKNLIFPNFHAKSNELYIAHPYLKESYLPFSTYESNLSSDKFDEFFYFVQCLGAKKIAYKVVKGNNTNQTKNSNLNIDLSVGLGKSIVKNTVSGAFDEDKKQKQQEDNLNSRTKTQTFSPVKAPYIPNDLLWYPHEQTWHRLYQQRVNGNILNHYEIISSKSAISVSNIEKNNLKLAFKNYFVDAGLNINHSIEETFEENESVEWEISIEFESITNLNDKTAAITEVSSDVKKEYLEEVKFMLEDDGIIDDKERRILERFRVQKGISKELAIAIENNLTSLNNLNENEKEYLAEYKELLNDGEINEKERRILNRMAIRYNISEQRVLELENH